MPEITKPPAHHSVDRWHLAACNLCSQRLMMGIGQDKPRARGFAVKQAFRPFGVDGFRVGAESRRPYR